MTQRYATLAKISSLARAVTKRMPRKALGLCIIAGALACLASSGLMAYDGPKVAPPTGGQQHAVDEYVAVRVWNIGTCEHFGEQRCELSMSLKLPEKAIKVTGGRITKAITGSGESILPEPSKPFSRHVMIDRLKKDAQTCEFDTFLLTPDEHEKTLKEVSGYLEYTTVTGSSRIGFRATDIPLPNYELSVDKTTGILIAKIPYVKFTHNYGRRDDKYNLLLMVKLPREVLAVTGGTIQKVTTGANKSLLPESKRHRRLLFPKLREDKKTVVFKVTMRNPEKPEEFLKEISGTLEYLTSDGTKQIDTGLIDFKAGTKIEEIEAVIESIEADNNRPGWNRLGLGLGPLPLQAILTAEFYSSDGRKLDVDKAGSQTVRILARVNSSVFYVMEGDWPPKGRIVLKVAQNVTTNKLGFRAVNISLDGDCFKSP